MSQPNPPGVARGINEAAYKRNPAWRGVQWVIVGGESGPNARPFDQQWARDIMHQCRDAGVPFFMKQMGSSPYDQATVQIYRDKKGGDISEWPEDLQIRELPEAAPPPEKADIATAVREVYLQWKDKTP
jgi:hypothetical protein